MKRLLTFALAILPALVSAQDDRNTQLTKSIYAKFEEVLGVNDYQAARRASLLIMAVPGLQVDQTLNPNKPEDRQKIVALVDTVPQGSWVYRASSQNTSDIYRAILDNHEPALTSLTAAQKAQLVSAQKKIYKSPDHSSYSEAYIRYRNTRDALQIALGNYQDFQRANPGLSVPAALRNALAGARDDFDLIGDKNSIIAAKAVIDNLENLDPNVFWGKLTERYNDNTFPVGAAQVPVYDLVPDFKTWLDDSQSWNSITLTDSDVESHSSSAHSSVGGGLGGSWGLFSFGGSYGHSETSTHVSVDGKDFNLTFELLRVSIRRPWMDPVVFSSGTWKWQPGSVHDGEVISNGADVDNGAAASGLMPFLPTEAILARNVKLTAAWSTDIKSTFDQQTTTSIRAGWGPFSGTYNRSDSSSSADSSVKISGNSITFVKPQIIGYLVEVVPLSPHKKDGVTFASDKPVKINGMMLDAAASRLFRRSESTDATLLKQAGQALKSM